MFTRKEGDDWIVVNTGENSYGVTEGDVFQWADSFCSQMVQGKGPQIAPDSNEVECYRDAPVNNQVTIRSYIGVPVKNPNGELFGTLCAIDPEPKPESIVQELPLVDMFGTVISRMIETEIRNQTEEREAESEAYNSEVDSLTGLKNRLAWELSLDTEESRARTLSSPTVIAIIKLISSTTETVLECSKNLLACLHEKGQLFRLGSDEFGVLLPDTHLSTTRMIMLEIRAAIYNAQLQASIGLATRDPKKDLRYAWERANQEAATNRSSFRSPKVA